MEKGACQHSWPVGFLLDSGHMRSNRCKEYMQMYIPYVSESCTISHKPTGVADCPILKNVCNNLEKVHNAFPSFHPSVNVLQCKFALIDMLSFSHSTTTQVFGVKLKITDYKTDCIDEQFCAPFKVRDANSLQKQTCNLQLTGSVSLACAMMVLNI